MALSAVLSHGWNAPGTIFNAVEATFDTKIFSEHEPQYWGFETEEEWDADEEKKGKESAERFHLEILKYLQGEPNDIQPGTDGMRVAEIAKKLVEKDPTLLLPVNKDKFRNEIQSAYENEYQSTERQMPNRDNPLMDTLESMLTFQRNWRGTGDVMPKIVNEEYLRTAQPHLICRMDLQTNG